MGRQRRKVADLIIEDHPEDYSGPEWLTLVHYINHSKLVVVDTLDKTYLWGYNFEDFVSPERDLFIMMMDMYWESDLYGEPLRNRVPVHEWIIDRGMVEIFGPRLVAYNINDILRVVGPVRYADPESEKVNVKRRKRVIIK